MKRRELRIQTCKNPRCTKGEDGKPKRFGSVIPARCCSDSCRQDIRYEARRRERLIELGLLRG